MISKTLLVLWGSLFFSTYAGPLMAQNAAPYQNIDPYQEHLRQLRELQEEGRRTQEDIRTFRDDQRRERLQRLSEQAYDRQACIRAGVRGPDIEQCVRDSAYFRRCGPGGCAPVALPPELHCQTVDYGGTRSTDCY